jgi:hypothetical protein
MRSEKLNVPTMGKRKSTAVAITITQAHQRVFI